ncbi:MAG: PQQ-like beta-propeller repeat protein [Clostridia bacterium]|nr:PQQ-like beta-propeller repeat protein [Clostridia bacterium]
MNIEWTFDLPTNEKSRDYHCESPIFIKDENLYFICCNPHVVLYIIDANTGAEKNQIECKGHSVIPSKYFFESYQNKIILYTGELWILENEQLKKMMPDPIDYEINSYVLVGHQFVFADRSYLRCIDLESLNTEWKISISNTKNYHAGEICLFEDTIACYGNDKLLFVDTTNGDVKYQIKIPRVDKLFMPIKVDDRTILIGYTNWSNAGILKYDIIDQKVLWKSKRSFEGPLLRCKLFLKENLIYWVKNDTELIGLNINTGEEQCCVKTTPWIYTDPLFISSYLVYGTSGRNGHFVNLNAQSGKERWNIFLENGCAFFDFYAHSVILGDFSKMIYQVDMENGKIIQTLHIGGEVVGRIKVHQNNVYTVVWGNKDTFIHLVKVTI